MVRVCYFAEFEGYESVANWLNGNSKFCFCSKPMPLLNIDQLNSDIDAHEGSVALIVTALPLEKDAVLGHFSEYKSCFGTEGSIYQWGNFTGEQVDWLVVVITTGPGNIGSGQQVAQAVMELGQVDLILFAGVAGSRKGDVPIGSVVAASKVYFAHHGKAEAGQVFGRTPAFDTAHHLVQLAVFICGERKWFHRKAEPNGGHVVADDYRPVPWPPQAIVKPIVAGEVVSADPEGELEQFIKQTSQDAVAIEMEGYGIMQAGFRAQRPTLIVRGISDARADKTPKADAFDQPYAAALAAAFAFEVLHVSPDQGGRRGFRTPIEQNRPGSVEPKSSTSETTGAQDTMLVMSIAGDFDSFTPERLQSMVEIVSRVSGADVSLVDARPGSVRLIIATNAPQKILSAAEDIADALADQSDVHLLGLTELTAFEQVEQFVGTFSSASVELLNWPMSLPNGQELERPELGDLLERVSSSESSTTVLTGGPGFGKSALLARLGHTLQAEGIAVWALKADALPSGVASDIALSEFLGLEGRVDDALRAIAMTRPVVVLLDQLDALASSLDLKTERLNVLLNLVRRLSGLPNIHFVLSARAFEYRHDVRLRAMEADEIELTPPGWPEVQAVLSEQGYNAENWPVDAQDLLRTPQVLVMFQQLAPDPKAPPFTGYQSLLDAVWEARLLGTEGGGDLSALLSDLAFEMAETEQLWLPRARFETELQKLKTLEALGFLATSTDQKKIGFAHQTLFDHALARRFTQESGRLSAYVKARRDSLFVRSKLWSALTYLREVDAPRYAGELTELLSEEALPRHLVHLLLDFLGQHADPLSAEWPLMSGALQREKDRPRAFAAMVGSPGWFDHFADTEIASAMAGGTNDQDFAARMLIGAWPTRPEKLTALLQEYWVGQDGSEIRLWNVISRHVGWSEDLQQLALHVIDRIELRSMAIDGLATSVGAVSPGDAVAIIARYFEKSLKAAIIESDRRAELVPPEKDEEGLGRAVWRINNDPTEPVRNVFKHGHWLSLEALAAAHPKMVLEGLWPCVMSAVGHGMKQRDSLEREFGFPFAYTVHFDLGGRHGDLMEGDASGAIRISVEALARTDPKAFVSWAEDAAKVEAGEIQGLISLAYRQNPKRLAEEALRFLLADRRRLVLRRTTGIVNLSARMIAEVSPYWQTEEIEQVITSIQSLTPDTSEPREDPQSRRWLIRHGRRIRQELLSALPEASLPEDVRRELAAETRRFGDPPEDDDDGGMAQHIGSPVPIEAFVHGSVEQIIDLLKSVPDQTGWDHPDRSMSGGSIQLSRLFADFAGDYPDKALLVIAKLDPAWGQRPAGYALEPLASALEPEQFMALFVGLDDRGFKDYEFRPSAARAIEKLYDKQATISDEVISRLEAWLPDLVSPPKASNAKDDESPVDSASEEPKDQSILWAYRGGMVLPGGAYPVLSVLIKCLLRQDAFEHLHKILADHLDRGERSDVWEALLRYMRYLQDMDTEKRDALIEQLFSTYPHLLYSCDGAALLARAQWWDGDLVERLVNVLAEMPEPKAEQVVGEVSALVAILRPEEDWAQVRLREVLSKEGNRDARLGAAYSAANLWDELRGRDTTLAVYQALLPSGDPSITGALTEIFRVSKGLRPGEHTERLLKAYVGALPGAQIGGDSFIVEALLALLPHHALLVSEFAKKLAEHWRDALADISTSIAFHARDLIDLAITLHRLGPETRQAGIDLFETMLEIDAYETEATLQELDRRFPKPGSVSRPRLRRPNRRKRTRRKRR